MSDGFGSGLRLVRVVTRKIILSIAIWVTLRRRVMLPSLFVGPIRIPGENHHST